MATVTLEFGITQEDAKRMAKTLSDASNGIIDEDRTADTLQYASELLNEIAEKLGD